MRRASITVVALALLSLDVEPIEAQRAAPFHGRRVVPAKPEIDDRYGAELATASVINTHEIGVITAEHDHISFAVIHAHTSGQILGREVVALRVRLIPRGHVARHVDAWLAARDVGWLVQGLALIPASPRAPIDGAAAQSTEVSAPGSPVKIGLRAHAGGPSRLFIQTAPQTMALFDPAELPQLREFLAEALFTIEKLEARTGHAF